MRRTLLIAGLLLVPLAAGCVSNPSEDVRPDDADPDPSGAPSAGTPGASGREPGEGAAAAARGWPDLAEAKVRPGVQVVSATGQCTSNFVFTSPDNLSVYLGLAAHCVDGMKLGDALEIDGGTATGTLAYSSWMTMDEVKEKDADALAYNDFALVRVDDAFRGLVHPAMRHFGGPTALAPSAEAAMGDKVLTYGNSGLRQEFDPASPHEGYVIDRLNAWTTEVYTATPGVPGDSGSGVLTGDGRALGVLVTLAILPTPGSNGVTSLDMALAYAAEHAGLEAALATWDALEPGLLPALSS